MNRKGFALLEIVVVLAIVAAIAGGGFYFRSLQNEGAMVRAGVAAEQQVREVTQQFASTTAMEQNLLLLTQATTSVSVATSSVAPPDTLAGLGSDIYASGNVPLGDGRYVTSAPKKGYIYLCNVNTNGGGGAEVNGPWIVASTWNLSQKISVEGSISWPSASYSMVVNGSTRTITTNDLPFGGVTTGIFPIRSSDPAHAYDTNPNSIKAQSLSFSFPTAPAFAATPSCIGGEVGVMTDGVMLFDGFDAEYRDAPAHELQDSCDGHPQESGEYHYHGPSSCLPNGSTTVIGFAFDGFPITGAKVSPNRYLTTADLDECHGITSPIVLDGKKVTMYHYVMTEDFPYSVSCFRGTPTVHGPTAGGGGQVGAGSSAVPQQQPPAVAIAACASQSAGASCSFNVPQGTVSGTCKTPPGQSSLVCVPNRN